MPAKAALPKAIGSAKDEVQSKTAAKQLRVMNESMLESVGRKTGRSKSRRFFEGSSSSKAQSKEISKAKGS